MKRCEFEKFCTASAKMSFTNEPANSAVLGYMKSQNRPYSVQNVFDNLRGEIGKAKVALAMDVCSRCAMHFMYE